MMSSFVQICVTLGVVFSLLMVTVDASSQAQRNASDDISSTVISSVRSERSDDGHQAQPISTVRTPTSTTTDYFLAEEELLEKEDETEEPEGQFAVREHFIKDPYEYDAPPVVEPPRSWFERLKSFFKPSSRNSVLGHAVEAGHQFREKYGGGSNFESQSLYAGGDEEYSGQLHRPIPGSMRPDGAMTPIQKPPVKLSLEADFIELNCVAHGRIMQGIRWVKLVGLNPHGHQLFATVADGDRVLFDTYHFSVRTNGRHSRLIIRNPKPESHYGVYQCQASVAGKPNIIVKEDFVIGKVV